MGSALDRLIANRNASIEEENEQLDNNIAGKMEEKFNPTPEPVAQPTIEEPSNIVEPQQNSNDEKMLELEKELEAARKANGQLQEQLSEDQKIQKQLIEKAEQLEEQAAQKEETANKTEEVLKDEEDSLKEEKPKRRGRHRKTDSVEDSPVESVVEKEVDIDTTVSSLNINQTCGLQLIDYLRKSDVSINSFGKDQMLELYKFIEGKIRN